MRIIKNNHQGGRERIVWCAYCYSKLAVTTADITLQETRHSIRCPCCGQTFFVPTEPQPVK